MTGTDQGYISFSALKDDRSLLSWTGIYKHPSPSGCSGYTPNRMSIRTFIADEIELSATRVGETLMLANIQNELQQK